MDLRHLRYFIAVAEVGSLHVAAGKRLHTAQPSLSRQMRDLEAELGCSLMTRSSRGIELTAAGRVFLDHARIILLQVGAAAEAARRAAEPARSTVVLGFLTGLEFDWLAQIMAIVREEIPDAEVTVLSRASPELAAGLMRGRIDLALLRPERGAPDVTFQTLTAEPLIVLMPADHRLASRSAVRPADLAEARRIGVPAARSPVLRTITDDYAARIGIDLAPHYEVDNLSMAVSLVASTGGVALMPFYARNLLPPTVVARPLEGDPPMIDIALGTRRDNPLPRLAAIIARVTRLDPGSRTSSTYRSLYATS
jgi:LysR family hca operon transcriptional activator